MTLGNVLIYGDSYSTFKDMVPDGYAVYYDTKREVGPNITEVNKTWWYPLIKETDSTLIRNDSWSGSTVCHTGYNGLDCSHLNSFIYRLRKMREEGFFKENRIDTVLVFGATNDNWADVEVGSTKYDDFSESELFKVLPGICYFLKELKATLPSAKIAYIINSELKNSITEGIKEACEHFSITVISLVDIEKDRGHPTELGMKQIKDQVLKILI